MKNIKYRNFAELKLAEAQLGRRERKLEHRISENVERIESNVKTMIFSFKWLQSLLSRRRQPSQATQPSQEK